MKEEKQQKQKSKKDTKEVRPSHTSPILARGRTFEGKVIRKFPKRITIELERTVYISKYERFTKKKTRIHARLPDTLSDKIQIGDLVKVQQCRPLSKIIHFIIIKKVKEESK